MSQVKPNLPAIKAAAKSLFGHIQGVEGFGLGEDSLRIYIRNAEPMKEIPSMFQGVKVDFVITSDITASDASGRTHATRNG